MATLRFDPWCGFEGLTRKMNRFAGELEKGFTIESGCFNPRVDITEDEKSIYLHVEIPGMNKENVSISVNDERLLTIKGDKQREFPSESRTFIRTERCYGNFSRTFYLPENVNLESIAAKFENGILEVSVQKMEPEKPKTIEVPIQ